MKKIIIGILVVVVFGVIVGMVLTHNKEENQAKIEVVNDESGAAPIRVKTVSRQNIASTFSSNGNFIPNRDLEFKSENSGRVTKILVDEGDRVKQGQILAVIDDKYLSLSLQAAKDNYQKLLTDKSRYESSFETGGVTQAKLDDIKLQLRTAENQLEEAKRRMKDADIKAPISGIINKKEIEVGAYLSPGTNLFEIVDVSTLKLKVSVNENRITQLHKGDSVAIHVPSFPKKTFTGIISYIAPKADASLNFPIEIKMHNDSETPIKAGMYATAVFNSEGVKNTLLVPRKAFVGSVNNREVYLLKGDSTVMLKTVIPGRIIGEKVEILEGLEVGDQVVTSGQINLSDGTKVVVQK